MQQDILFWRLQKLEPCGVFPSGIHHIADHPAPDIPIISATGDFFVDRPFFCGIEKKFTVDLIQVFRYPVVFDSFQIFFYHYPLQLGEQVACMDSCGGRCLPCGSQKGKRQFPFWLRLLPFSELCVQTKAKVRLLSAHKVYPCAPLLYRQNVGVVYG